MDRNLEEEYEEIQNKYIRFVSFSQKQGDRSPYQRQLEEQEETSLPDASDIPPDVAGRESGLPPIPKQICIICKGTYSHFNKKRHDMTRKHLNALQV
jgi:hypothetical protein